MDWQKISARAKNALDEASAIVNCRISLAHVLSGMGRLLDSLEAVLPTLLTSGGADIIRRAVEREFLKMAGWVIYSERVDLNTAMYLTDTQDADTLENYTSILRRIDALAPLYERALAARGFLDEARRDLDWPTTQWQEDAKK